MDINWTEAQLKPNGVSIYAYNSDGTLYRQFPPFSNPAGGYIELPVGTYNLIVFNNTPDELSGIGFRGMDHWNTLETYLKPRQSTIASKGKLYTSTDEILAQHPDTLAVARITDFVVTKQMVQLYHEKPRLDNNETTIVIKATPKRVISVVTIIARVKGLKYAAGPPWSKLSGLAESYSLGKGSYSEKPVSHEFLLNNRQFDPGSTVNGTISKSFTTFGLRGDVTKASRSGYLFDIDFTLIDGQSYHPEGFPRDVSDDINISIDLQINLDLLFELELPTAINGGEGEGVFAVDVDGWNDVKIKL